MAAQLKGLGWAVLFGTLEIMLPWDVQIVGDALNSQGFVAFETVEGLGLNTFGFLWPLNGIWSGCCEPASVTWVECDC